MSGFKRKEGVKIGIGALLDDDSISSLRVVSRVHGEPDDDNPAHVFLPKWRTTLAYPADIVCAFDMQDRVKGFVSKLLYKAILIDEKIQQKNYRGPCLMRGQDSIKNDEFDLEVPKKVFIDYCVVLDALIEYIAEQNGIDPVRVALYVYTHFGMGIKAFDAPNRFLVLCVLSQMTKLSTLFPMPDSKSYGISYKSGAWFNFVIVKGWDYKKPYYFRGVVFSGLTLSFYAGKHLTQKLNERTEQTMDRWIGQGQTAYKKAEENGRCKLNQIFHCNAIPKSKFSNFVEKT